MAAPKRKRGQEGVGLDLRELDQLSPNRRDQIPGRGAVPVGITNIQNFGKGPEWGHDTMPARADVTIGLPKPAAKQTAMEPLTNEAVRGIRLTR